MKKENTLIHNKMALGGLGLLLLILVIWVDSQRIKIVDKSDTLMRSSTKSYKSRTLDKIRQIVVHHSASIGQRAEDYAIYHVNSKGWPGIGYHIVIEVTGLIVQCHPLTTICYGVENNNTPSINICLSGHFGKQEPSLEQLKSLKKVIAHFRKQLPQYLPVKGHKEYKATSCPGVNLVKHLYQYNAA
jgi:hypothetical protein